MFKNNSLKSKKYALLISVISAALLGCNASSTDPKSTAPAQSSVGNIDIWPALDIAVKTDPLVEQKVAKLLSTMSIEQKVAQMIQPEIRDISVEDMRQYGFGSYLNGGGAFPDNNKHATPADWIRLAESLYQASIDDSFDGSRIPTMWGTDAVHGHNNVIGATLFPHNIGLGAANNVELIEKIAAITAKEVMVTGIDWVFAPTVAVVRDDRWGRTYEGYSEDPEIVKSYSAAIVKGLQGTQGKNFLDDDHVISTVKHFIGDGGTQNGDDQGDNLATEQELFDLHAQGYVGGLSVGAQSVMASFNSWHGNKIHGNKYLLTNVLKDRMGFDGFVVGDWNGHGQIKGCSNESCPQAINAGLDIFMVPTGAWKPLLENTIAQVKGGEISLARLDDAVSRILRVKIRAGLFDKPSPAKRALSGKTELIGAAQHRAVARQAVRESLVLLKNNQQLLPLKPNQAILVTGDGADNIGKQSGGWTVTWQGTGNNNNDFPGGSSIYDGIKDVVEQAGGSVQLSADGSYQQKPDVAIVVFGEDPYAEGNGDLDNLEYQRGEKTDLALLKKLKSQGIAVVSVFISGRPMWVNAELNASDAFVAAWLPGSEGAGIADVIMANLDGTINHDFTGKLSFSWPANAEQSTVNHFDQDYQPLLPYGFGLHYGDQDFLPNNLPQVTTTEPARLTSLKLFQRSVQKPWHIALVSGQTSTTIASNVQSQGAISYKTIDKEVQEDARSIVFNGSELASIKLLSDFPEDLRAHLEANSALTFTVRIDQAASDEVNLAMLCEDQCLGEQNITALFAGLPINQWQTVAIDLTCFKASGANFSKIFSPFALSTSGKFAASFADIAIVPNALRSETSAAISCPSAN